MPTWLKVILGIVVAIIALIAIVMYSTSGMTKTADNFFTAVHDKQMSRAYADLSSDFQAGTSQTELTAFLQSNGLADITKTRWSSRSINGGQGTLEGTVTNATGDALPIKLVMVKGKDGWKIQSLRKSAAGATASDTLTPTVPAESEQITLVRDTLGAFADSVAARDMTAFRNHTARMLQEQYSVEELDKAYHSFFAFGSSLESLKTIAPVFDKPAFINEDGVLVIDGHYPGKPNPLNFTAKYIFEGTGWKTFGLEVKVKPQGA